MEKSNQSSGNGNRPNENVKQQQNNSKFNQSDKNKNEPDKKQVYIKDMPPIDGARSGVI